LLLHQYAKYFKNLLIKFKYPHPLKPSLSPYKCLPISYGAKAQLTPEPDASELLKEHRKCRIQEIVAHSSTLPEQLTTNVW